MSSLAVRVYYEDTDAGGVVYHANHIKYFERARTEWLRERGYDQDRLMEDDLCFVVRDLSVQYRRPALFNDLLQVTTEVSEVKRASVRFTQAIFNSQQQLIAEATVTVASVALSAMKACALPAEIKEEFIRAR